MAGPGSGWQPVGVSLAPKSDIEMRPRQKGSETASIAERFGFLYGKPNTQKGDFKWQGYRRKSVGEEMQAKKGGGDTCCCRYKNRTPSMPLLTSLLIITTTHGITGFCVFLCFPGFVNRAAWDGAVVPLATWSVPSLGPLGLPFSLPRGPFGLLNLLWVPAA